MFSVITTLVQRIVRSKWVLLKCGLILLLLSTVSTLLLGFYGMTSDARYGHVQRAVEIAGWYGVISDSFLLPVVATAIAAFLVSLVYAGVQDLITGSLDRLRTLSIAALFVLAGTVLRLYLLLNGWVWGSDWGLHSGMVYEMMLYKDYRGFGWGWAGGSPSDPSSTYICNPPLPYLITLFLLNTFIPNMGVPESTYLSHINQYITPMLWVTTALVESLAIIAILSVVKRATGRLSLAMLASTVSTSFIQQA